MFHGIFHFYCKMYHQVPLEGSSWFSRTSDGKFCFLQQLSHKNAEEHILRVVTFFIFIVSSPLFVFFNFAHILLWSLSTSFQCGLFIILSRTIVNIRVNIKSILNEIVITYHSQLRNRWWRHHHNVNKASETRSSHWIDVPRSSFDPHLSIHHVF